ncbi:MAG TPA: phage terminase large subunit [Pirellulales bacterium]|jgi:predicted phage terminase large subunit-like protein
MIKQSPMTESIDPRYLDAATTLLCEKSLFDFVVEAWPVVEPGTRLVSTWHVRAVCDHLEACTRGQIRRLVINIPPRCMKSLLVSVFWPAWVWTTRPHTRWLFASYAHHLSLRDSLHCRDIIQSTWYRRRWGDRFALRDDQNQKTRFDNDKTGFRLASSTGGVGTGEGGDFIVADDPHNVTQAESDTQREAVLHWWDQSMSTRGNDPRTVCHVVVMQRLHERDLAGHLLEQGGYEHLCLPMEFEPGRRCTTSVGWQDPRQKENALLCPTRFPWPAVQELKRRLGLYGTAGQLQQRPAPLDGGLFQRSWFRIVPVGPQGCVRRVRYWDLAASIEGDYTCGVLMSRDETGTFYIEDVRRGRWNPTQRDAIIQQTAKTDGQFVEIVLEQEPGSAGKSVTEYLGRRLAGHTVIFDRPTGAKIVRAQPLASQCGINNVCLVAGSWNDAYIHELCVFPNGRNDDQVDASSGAFARLARYAGANCAPEFLHLPRPDPRRHGIFIERRGDEHIRLGHRRR